MEGRIALHGIFCRDSHLMFLRLVVKVFLHLVSFSLPLLDLILVNLALSIELLLRLITTGYHFTDYAAIRRIQEVA